MSGGERVKVGDRVSVDSTTQPSGSGTVVGWTDPFGPIEQLVAVVVDDDELGEPGWYRFDELSRAREEG